MNRNHPVVPTFTPPPNEFNFLASKDERYDYSNLYAFTAWLQKQLKKFSISSKHPLLIVSKSSDKLVFLLAGCFLLNKPFISVSPLSTQHEMDRLFSQIDPGAVFGKKSIVSKFPPLKDHPILSIPKRTLRREGNWNPDFFSLQHSRDVAGFFLTSGSTATPKIVPVKRRQVFFATEASADNFKPEKNAYWLLCLPLNHIGGISIIFRSLLYQSAIYRMDNFDENLVRTFLSENKLFQVASLVPTMLVKLLDDPIFQVHKSFKAVLLGGGPIPLQLINQAETRGIPIVLSYGMTETCAQIAANPLLKPSGVYVPKKSVGNLFSPNQIQIRDEDGTLLHKNEPGQIWLKGPQVFDGYLDKSLNRSVFDGEWFNTGDYGHLNRFNQLFIETRRTDRIITGGENVTPVEVEETLNQINGISESAVFGVDDDHWGQKVVAFVVAGKGEQTSPVTIKKKLSETLSEFKIPKEIIFVESIPKTSIGKIKRDLLSSRYYSIRSVN